MKNEMICLDSSKAKYRLLLLHGWGADAEDLLPLGKEITNFDSEAFELISFKAPQNHPDGIGRQWYPLYPHQWNEVPKATTYLADLIKNCCSEKDISIEKTFLLGFSQGGAMALEIALKMNLRGVIACSSYPHPNWQPKSNMPELFLSHGISDQVVPYQASEKTKELVMSINSQCELFLFDGGHEIPQILIEKLQIILRQWII